MILIHKCHAAFIVMQTDQFFRMPARGEGEGGFNDIQSTPGQSHQATVEDITLEDPLPDYGG